jgi:hypothetical protein
MVHLLRNQIDRLDMLVPIEAASAATMLSLGADRILMGPIAHLSAVDTSLTHDLSPLDRDNDRVGVSQDELERVVRLWRENAGAEDENPYRFLFKHVHPLVIGGVDRASALSTRICREILATHLTDSDRINAISAELNAGYPSHSYPITLVEARRRSRPTRTPTATIGIQGAGPSSPFSRRRVPCTPSSGASPGSIAWRKGAGSPPATPVVGSGSRWRTEFPSSPASNVR